MKFGIEEKVKFQKAARRQVEIEREIPRFKNKVHSSSKEYKRSKHKNFQYDEEI